LGDLFLRDLATNLNELFASDVENVSGTVFVDYCDQIIAADGDLQPE
jgi:hypothetical protein